MVNSSLVNPVEELVRIVERVRRHWPKTEIVVRGDSGFCRDDIMTWCDDNDVDYLFGLARSARLAERVGRRLRKSPAAAPARRRGGFAISATGPGGPDPLFRSGEAPFPASPRGAVRPALASPCVEAG